MVLSLLFPFHCWLIFPLPAPCSRFTVGLERHAPAPCSFPLRGGSGSLRRVVLSSFPVSLLVDSSPLVQTSSLWRVSCSFCTIPVSLLGMIIPVSLLGTVNHPLHCWAYPRSLAPVPHKVVKAENPSRTKVSQVNISGMSER